MADTRLKCIIAAILMVAIVPVSAWASTGLQGGAQGPPPEAVEACSGKTEGQAITFTGRRGEQISATCKMVGEQLAAVPDNPPPPGDGQAPPSSGKE